MSYLNIISVAQAKAYLGVDDSFHDTDIERMIKSALSSVENETSYILYARDKEYILSEGKLRVYDYPINSVTSPTDTNKYESTLKTLYTIYDVSDTEIDKITLNVGYSDSSDIPLDLIQVAYDKIDMMFNRDKKGLPQSSITVLNQRKRFLI